MSTSGKVFISYARVDDEFALRLARDLRSAGIDLWIDQLDIPAGYPWDSAAEEALDACSTVLVVLSPDAVESRSVMDEVAYALDEGKPTLPVLYRPCRVPLRLRRLQRVDFTSDYPGALSQLVGSLSTGEPAASSRPARTDEAVRPARDARDQPAAEVRPRLRGAVRAGLAGALYGALAMLMLYMNDPRTGTGAAPALPVQAALGALGAGSLWAVAGALSEVRKAPLAWAIGASLSVIVVWVVVFGTYADVLAAAFVLGGPVGGIAGAAVGRLLER